MSTAYTYSGVHIAIIPMIVLTFLTIAEVWIFCKKESEIMPEKLKRSLLLSDFWIFLTTLYADFFTKDWIRVNMKPGDNFDIIPDILLIYHLENTGAVWGMMKGQILLFVICTVLIMAGCIAMLIKIPTDKKYGALHVSLALVLSGAVGNMIDRIYKQSVTDFIYFRIINFPIFNYADICVVIAVFLLLYLFLFKYKDDDLTFIHFGSKSGNKKSEAKEKIEK